MKEKNQNKPIVVNYDRLQRLMIEMMLGTSKPRNSAERKAVESLVADLRLAGPGALIEFPLD